MNTFNKALLGALVMSATASAFAGNTADLTVTGVIAPVACTPSFVGGGTVDYGKISARELDPTKDTVLAEKHMSYVISCDAPVAMATRWTDARAATKGGSTYGFDFGLGEAAGKKIGAFKLSEDNYSLKADGSAASLMVSKDGGKTWADKGVNRDFKTPGSQQLAAYSSYFLPGKTPKPFKTVSGTVNITALIAPSANLDLSEEIKLDGLATMEVVYL